MRNHLTKLYNYHEYPEDGSHRFTGSWYDVTIFNYQPGSLPLSGGTGMSTRIPVVYASPKGSTAEIAQAVGKELQSTGHDTDVIAIKSVTSLESYKAVASGVRSLWVKSWRCWKVCWKIPGYPVKNPGRRIWRWCGPGKKSH